MTRTEFLDLLAVVAHDNDANRTDARCKLLDYFDHVGRYCEDLRERLRREKDMTRALMGANVELTKELRRLQDILEN